MVKLKLVLMKSQQKRRVFALALTMAICLLPINIWAQTEAVQGTVTDSSNGNPIPGAFVMVQGTKSGASTDTDGRYSLSLKGIDNPVIVVSCLGYTTQEINVGGRSTIDVALAPDSEYLDEVVVIGYGTLDKK